MSNSDDYVLLVSKPTDGQRPPPPIPQCSLIPGTVTLSVSSGRAIGIYTRREMLDSGAFLPLFLTQEGGEGRGEEAWSSSLPTRSSRGERQLVHIPMGRAGVASGTRAAG
jgi:hypothetical protein